MTDKLRTAAQAVLKTTKFRRRYNEALAELEAALAEPAIKESLTVAEQKPMLEMNPQKREWVGLTDDEIKEAANSCVWSETYHVDFSRAIEAKLREKNT